MDKLDELLTCDDIWDDVLSRFDNLSDCLECFNLIISGLLDILVPLKRLRVHQQDCPWLSSASLAKARRLRDIAHRKALKSGSGSDWSSYRSLRNRVNSMLRSAKAAHFSDLASSLRSKPGKFLNLCLGIPNLLMMFSFLLLLMHLTIIICQLHTGLLLV